MTIRIAFLVFTLAGLVLAVFAFPARSERSTTSTKVELSGMSPDEKENYLIRIYEPWDGAGRRVILFAGAAVTNSGLPSHFLVSTSDIGQGTAALKAGGERFNYTATPATGSWTTVVKREDVVVEAVSRK